MPKEVRANFIFISVLLVLVLPGFVILMSKKLRGSSEPNYMPPAMPHEAAYIQPDPVPPTAPRIEPPLVRGWLTRLLHDRVDPKASVARDETGAGPVVGDQHVTQLVYASEQQLVVLIWSEKVQSVSAILTTVSTDVLLGELAPTWIDVPPDIRHALQTVGYINPPQRIAWVTTNQQLSPAKATLQLTYDDKTEHIQVP